MCVREVVEPEVEEEGKCQGWVSTRDERGDVGRWEGGGCAGRTAERESGVSEDRREEATEPARESESASERVWRGGFEGSG